MNWILENIQIVFAIGAAFAYWLNSRKEARQGKEGQPPHSPEDFSQAEAEDPERTRRVQEEIRRKIAERRGAPPVSPVPAQESVPLPAPPVLPSRPLGGLREKIETKLAQVRQREVEAALARERHQELEARMRSMEAERIANQQRAIEIAALTRSESKRAASSGEAAQALAAMDARAWLDGLRNPNVARRAVVLREVLGPPVGLR